MAKFPVRQSSCGPVAQLEDVRESLPEIASAIDALIAAVARARAANAVKEAAGTSFITIDGPENIRVFIGNGHAG